MRSYIILFITLLAIPVSARKHIPKGAKPVLIDSLYCFEPVSGIGLISYRNDFKRNDSLAAANQLLQKRVLSHNAEKIKLAAQIETADTLLQRRIKAEIFELISNAGKKKYFEELGHPSVIDSMMDAGHKRFALLLLNQGFVRTPENKRWSNHKANLYGRGATGGGLILSLFQNEFEFNGIPFMGTNCNFYAMIIDAQENRTYFFNEDISRGILDYDPLNVNELNVQFHNLFEGFFFPVANLQRL